MIDEKNTDYKVSYSENGECSLRIEETFTEDSARFSCIANNIAGSAVTTAILSVVGNYLNKLYISWKCYSGIFDNK